MCETSCLTALLLLNCLDILIYPVCETVEIQAIINVDKFVFVLTCINKGTQKNLEIVSLV